MTERAEHKGWQAHAAAAAAFFAQHGGDAMTVEDRRTYDAMLHDVQTAADRHDHVRSRDR